MRKILNISLVLLLSGSFVGCKKFLEKAPDMRTDLNNVEKVKSLLSTAYTTANYISFMEAASDNVGDKGPLAPSNYVYEINRGPYMFEDITGETGQDSPNYYWNRTWEAMAAANHALRAIEEVEVNEEAYMPYKGEALLCRAYAHFMLVTIYAHAYDPQDADSHPGIPYVDEPGTVVQAQYDRKTVAYVYERIEKDLEEGLPLINNSAYKVPKFHFNFQAAHAFAARFYLFKRDFEKVVKHANLVFPEGDYSAGIRPWVSVYNNWSTEEMRVNYTRSNEAANLLLGETTSWWGRRYYRYRFGLTAALLNELLREPSKNVIGKGWAQRTSSYSSATHLRMNKFDEYFVYTTASTGRGKNMIPLFSAEEALFNRAEAYANLGQYDKALADLNLYATERISNYNSSTDKVTLAKIENFYQAGDPKEGVVKTVLDFKRSEFIQEGLRWFDILRHKITVRHEVLGTDGNVERTIEVPPGDPRRMFQMPPEVKLAGIEPNPR